MDLPILLIHNHNLLMDIEVQVFQTRQASFFFSLPRYQFRVNVLKDTYKLHALLKSTLQNIIYTQMFLFLFLYVCVCMCAYTCFWVGVQVWHIGGQLVGVGVMVRHSENTNHTTLSQEHEAANVLRGAMRFYQCATGH